jgi:hypothetical protein
MKDTLLFSASAAESVTTAAGSQAVAQDLHA